MPPLKGSKTELNLRDALAGESQANRRHLRLAGTTDVEGLNDVAAFRSTSEERSRKRQADRSDGRQPQGRDRLRDPRIRRHLHGRGSRRPPEGFAELADWFCDAHQGWEVACQPIPKGARGALI